MSQASPSETVLITGGDGFTGIKLSEYLVSRGYNVVRTVHHEHEGSKAVKCDIRDLASVEKMVAQTRPDFVFHLAGISFVAEKNASLIYDVNVIGSENILLALAGQDYSPKKVIMASSANVYGNLSAEILDETMCPAPVSHYAVSKFGMERIAANYFDKMDIILTRPFNYTGPGHGENFLVPKIVRHFHEKKSEVELGNMDVFREINDIRDVVKIYYQLMTSDARSKTVNICSGRDICLGDIIEKMNELAGYNIRVNINPDFVRKNEVKRLLGSTRLLAEIIDLQIEYDINDTLKSMFYNNGSSSHNG